MSWSKVKDSIFIDSTGDCSSALDEKENNSKAKAEGMTLPYNSLLRKVTPLRAIVILEIMQCQRFIYSLFHNGYKCYGPKSLICT